MMIHTAFTRCAAFVACFLAGAALAAEPSLPTVKIFTTGGTIAGSGSSSTDLTNYKAGGISGNDLVKSVPELQRFAKTEVEQIANVGSYDLTIAHWISLARKINETLADPAISGVVITHGTNTIEETAYFLNLTVKSDKPVVLVGAMRPATAISADGPLNLINAVRVAIAPDARGKGAMVVLNDEISSARDVTKEHTSRVEAFRPTDFGYLGYIDEDKVAFYRAPVKRHTANSEFDVSKLDKLPPVDILYAYIQPTLGLVDALAKAGSQGIVFAGTGAGDISTPEREALGPIMKLKPEARPIFVRSSRVGNGRVTATKDYEPFGMIAADTLNPQKARILLMLALTKTRDLKELQRIFSEY